MATLLITGASGLVGTRLTELLLSRGHQVRHLGRKARSGSVPSFTWDVDSNKMDVRALDGVDTVIHLAGAGVADRRWSTEWKKEILESRTRSSELLCETLRKTTHTVKAVVSASAIGYYGFTLSEQVFTEDSEPGKDFLATVVKQWEQKVDEISTLGIRVAKVRVGIVLSDRGGALKEMAAPVNWCIGAPLGSGKQHISWIHLDDLCMMFVKCAKETSMRGAYNGTGPYAVTNQELTQAIARVLRRPLWLPNIPPFVLRAIIGGMSEVVINGSDVSSSKIQRAGFVFQFPKLEQALTDLLHS